MPLATFVFSFFLTYDSEGKGERKKEETASEEDLPQQDRRTRYAAKAWSVDKIASSWNEDRLKRKDEERRRHKARCERRKRKVSAKETAENDGTKAILKIGAKGIGVSQLVEALKRHQKLR